MSATPWQMTPWIQEAYQAGVLTLLEASCLEDFWLAAPVDQFSPLPPSLQAAGGRMGLWEMQVASPHQ